LEGGIMVMEEHPGGIPHRILRESEWYWLGRSALFTSQYHSDSCRKSHRLDNFESHGLEIMRDLGEVHFSQVSTTQIHVKNHIDWTILRVTDWKLWVRWPQNQCESGIWNLLHRKQVVRLEDKLAIMMMGSKDCCLSNFTLF
jgi:hypothetical protein